MARVEYKYRGIKLDTMKKFIADIETNMITKTTKEFKVIERDENGSPKLLYQLQKWPGMTARESIINFKMIP